jgi:hypothetical protein
LAQNNQEIKIQKQEYQGLNIIHVKIVIDKRKLSKKMKHVKEDKTEVRDKKFLNDYSP